MTTIASPGAVLGVDWEERVNFARLRTERLARARAALEASELGALILFDQNNIRYTTATHIGNWARDKLFRCVLLMRDADPILWDIGSAARQHKMHASWLPESSWQAGISSWRGSIPEDVGVETGNAKRLADHLREKGLHGEPIGVDVVEIPVLRALEAQGLHIVNGQELMQQARKIKTVDEIALLDHSAGMVDAAYDELYRNLHVGMRENEAVALVNKVLYLAGSEEVEAVNAISGERCSPHPHVFSDRATRPGDTAYFDIIHSFNGYRTCYYRTLNVGSSNAAQRDAYQRARDAIDQAIAAVRPGATSQDVALALPSAADLGYSSEEEAFGLQYCHGVGLSVWEQPLISRYHSLEHPVPIEEGMVFALETYWPTKDGASAARIEEEVVVTADGAKVITRFPADELLVAGTRYWNGFSFNTATLGERAPASRNHPTDAEGGA
ncbi:M24 family metallopeptidase [Enemella evansiae]|uniref:M24 family metallopeptidase n=1 Tax=Enemella evansiae TaxID=2016499 RepID=UPI00105E430E|nr:Xaa-Pro peptidase family protein [Enemella evansiae]TDO89584.1 Xaa-Pro aminopeptidase [Enemella evansiae]